MPRNCPITFGKQRVLTEMAHSIAVRQVCSPILMAVSDETPIWDAFCLWREECRDRVPSDPSDYIAVVTKNGSTSGWLDFTDLAQDSSSKAPVHTVVSPVNIDDCLSADTSLLEAATLFSKAVNYSYLVLEKNELVGCLAYHDLISTPFKACLFSLLLSLEEIASVIIRSNPNLALRKLERSKLDRIRRKRDKDPTASELVGRLYFSDKLQILSKCKSVAADVPFLSRQWVREHTVIRFGGGKINRELRRKPLSGIDYLVEVRNALAHPSGNRLARLLPQSHLSDFVSWTVDLETQLEDYLVKRDHLLD